jgi:hypothetical protein
MDNDQIKLVELAVLLGGTACAFYKYILYNEGQDKLQMDVQLKVVNKSTGFYLLELQAEVTNMGKVRAKIPMRDFTYILKLYESENYTKGSIAFQIDGVDKFQWLKSETDDRDDYTWINGNTTVLFRTYRQVPVSFIYAKLLARIDYSDKERDWQTAEKLIKLAVEVPKD